MYTMFIILLWLILVGFILLLLRGIAKDYD